MLPVTCGPIKKEEEEKEGKVRTGGGRGGKRRGDRGRSSSMGKPTSGIFSLYHLATKVGDSKIGVSDAEWPK